MYSSAFSLTSLINLFGNSNSATSNFHYIEQLSGSLQSFGLFPICYLEHSNEVSKWIILFISGIWMSMIALRKLVQRLDDPLMKPSSTEITNVLNTLQNLSFFYKVWNDMLEFLQRFKSFHVYDTARKQSSILSYFSRK